MYPIHDGPGQRGLGMGYETFSKEFLNVCKEHLHEGRAQGFAFLFYEQGGSTDLVLNQADGFRLLNETSGQGMTIFYLSNPPVTGKLFREFNQTFMKALGLKKQTRPPCIVFFKVDGEMIEDIWLSEIDEQMQHFMVLEQIRRCVVRAREMWESQGDFSALSPMPLMSFVGAVGKFAGAHPL